VDGAAGNSQQAGTLKGSCQLSAVSFQPLHLKLRLSASFEEKKGSTAEQSAVIIGFKLKADG
jgi:hypothetical protein